MQTIEQEVYIDATPEAVWAVLGDLGSFADWSPVVRSVTHDGRDGVGATRTCRVSPMGRLDEEVVEWDPGHRVALRTTGGMPMEATATWTINPDGDGAQATVVLDYELKGGAVGRLLDRAMVRNQLDRNFRRNLEGLRDRVNQSVRRPSGPSES